MPRNISFALTTPQFIDGSKTVTRRMGWLLVKVGDLMIARRKVMGFKKGEQMDAPLGTIKISDHRLEPLNRMTTDKVYGREECVKEGFPDWEPEQFVEMFCNTHTGCFPEREITRMEFVKL